MQNSLLITSKVLCFVTHARLSYANNWALSLFTSVPLSFNRLNEVSRPAEKRSIADVPITFDLNEAPPLILATEIKD